jgi:hypothetical protein
MAAGTCGSLSREPVPWMYTTERCRRRAWLTGDADSRRAASKRAMADGIVSARRGARPEIKKECGAWYSRRGQRGHLLLLAPLSPPWRVRVPNADVGAHANTMVIWAGEPLRSEFRPRNGYPT